LAIFRSALGAGQTTAAAADDNQIMGCAHLPILTRRAVVRMSA
jgi:hypothetical protein